MTVQPAQEAARGRELSRLGRRSGSSLVGQLARAGLNAGLFVVAARVLGIDGFGSFVGSVAMAALAAPFANLGAMSVMIRRNAQHPDRVAADYWSAVVVTVGCGLAVSTVLCLVNAVVSALAVGAGILFLIAVSDLVGYRLAELSGAALQSRDWIWGTAYFPALVTLGRLVGVVVTWWTVGGIGLVAWAVSYSAWSLLAGALVVGGTGALLGRARPRPLAYLREWREGLMYSIGLSAQGVYNDIDKVMLASLYSLQSAGIYAAAYRAIDLAFVPMRAVLSTTYVRFFRAGTRGIDSSVSLAKSLLVPGLLLSCGASAALFLCADLLPLVLGGEYRDVVWVVRLLAVIPVLRTLHYLAADSLTGAGKQGVRTSVQVGAAVVTVAVNIVVIPVYGISGAIASSILADLGLAIVLWALALANVRQARREMVCR